MAFNFHKNGKLEYLTVPSFDMEENWVHCFTTRNGGVSKGHLATMNLGLSRGDKIENVRNNLEILGSEIGFCAHDTVYTNQQHKDSVKVITEEYKGMGAYRDRLIEDMDAIITNRAGIPLVGYYADCVPVFFGDPVKNAVGVCHSGWRGTVLEIVKKTVSVMENNFGSQPKDIKAAIGPSIGPCHFEVGEEVAEEFLKVFPNGFVERAVKDKYYINLQAAIKHTLEASGVQDITMANECTFCNPQRYYSHRQSKGAPGNMAAIIMIKE